MKKSELPEKYVQFVNYHSHGEKNGQRIGIM